MKNTLTRIFLITLTTVLLICTMAGISVFATEAEADSYEIKSINVIHDEKSIVLIAVDLPSDTELTEAPDVKVTYTFDGETLDAKFHSYLYIEKYGAYYPCYYTVGIAPVDIAEEVVATAYKTGASADEAKAKSVSLAEYLYTRLYRDDVISATKGDDLDRRGMYLALLEYGSYAQNVFHNNKAENAGDLRTLANKLIYVTAKGATVNGVDALLIEKSAEITIEGTPEVPSGSVLLGWQATTYDENGNIIAITPLDSNTYTAENTTVISPAYKNIYEDYEDGECANSIDNTGGGGTAAIVKENDNSFYRVSKPADTKTKEYIYIPNSGITFDDSDCVVFEAKLRITYDYANIGSFDILYGNYNGLKKLTFSNAAGSKALSFTDWRSGASKTIGGDTGVNVGEWFNLRIENYLDASNNTIARIYINGVYFGESTNAGVLGSASADHNYSNITILSNNNMLNCTVDIDDSYVGEGNMKTIDEVANDFENSTIAANGGVVTNSNITATLKADAATSFSIAKKEDGNYLLIDVQDKNSYLTISKTYDDADGANRLVFEADVMYTSDFRTDLHYAEVYNTTNVALYNDTGIQRPICYGTWPAYTLSNTYVKLGQWFKYRAEYTNDESGNIVVVVYVNGNEIYRCTTTRTTDVSTIKNIQVISSQPGQIGLDNVKFYYDVAK